MKQPLNWGVLYDSKYKLKCCFFSRFFFFKLFTARTIEPLVVVERREGGGGVKGESFGYTPNLNPYLRKRAGVYGQRKPYV